MKTISSSPFVGVQNIGLWVCAVLLLSLACTLPAIAQQFLRIAAIVNDEIISGYDLRSRIDFVIFSSRLPNNTDVRERISFQVLNRLINEKLKLQEAKRLKIKISPKQINSAIGQVEQQNQLSTGEMLKLLNNRNIDPYSFESRIRAEIAWHQIVRNKLARSGVIDDEAIDEQIELIKRNKGKPEYLVGEIYISFDSVKTPTNAKQLANRLYQQITNGARFDGVARSFSQSASATRAGNLGWIRGDQLDPDLARVVSDLARGELSKPIKGPDGYYIFQLRNKRLAKGLSQEDASVSLRQRFLPLRKNAPKGALQAQLNLAKSVSISAQNCDDMGVLEKEIGTGGSGSIKDIKLSKLAPHIRGVAQNLDIGKAGAPIRTKNGILILMVCSRKLNVDDTNIRRRLSQQLSVQRAELISRRTLIDLRRSAFIEIRK